MDALIDLMKIIFQYILPAVVAYCIGIYRERAVNNKKHDKEIFDKINNIINSQDMANIIHYAGMGMLPRDVSNMSDDLFHFSQNIANCFIDKKLQKNYRDFAESLHHLFILYSKYSDDSGSKPYYKLTSFHRERRENDELIVKNNELVSDFERTYSIFRKRIKNKFSI